MRGRPLKEIFRCLRMVVALPTLIMIFLTTLIFSALRLSFSTSTEPVRVMAGKFLLNGFQILTYYHPRWNSDKGQFLKCLL